MYTDIACFPGLVLRPVRPEGSREQAQEYIAPGNAYKITGFTSLDWTANYYIHPFPIAKYAAMLCHQNCSPERRSKLLRE